MDEFVSLNEKLGISVDDRGLVLSYLHPAREKTIRGKRLGLNYTKEGLLEQFKRNEVEFKERPGLKQHLGEKLPNFHEDRKTPPLLGGEGFPFLKGREYILIKEDNRWENIKQRNGRKIGTTGSLIEFVANHKNLSVLQALSRITGNNRLLLYYYPPL